MSTPAEHTASFAACLNPATVSGLSFPQVAEAAAAAGISHIEASIQQITTLGPARAAALLERLGVTVAAACGLLPDGPVLPHPLLADEATYTQALTGLADRLAAFTAIGCRVATIVVNPRTDLEPSAARDLAASRLGALAAACADHEVMLAVEPVGVRAGLPPSLDGRHAFITSLPQLRDFLDGVGDAALAETVGVCVDSFHWAASGADPAHLTGLGPWRILHVQLADTPADALVPAWTDEMRVFPGDGTLDWPVFNGALTAAGYCGPVSVELFNPHLRALPIEEICARAHAAVLSVAGRR
ncbi:sugar phosphate isomerase/epimerase family protein [Acrocarpospora catenulata]|uniref:sugar phosphate isomerase/epimerase family protein n=1 Tax=Acrocarpospora catenulata TaxID=2836182 RepID=UPI001BDAF014|nr:sugar phosphate isomerase/epimerase family protein [Acrocarpospora catenulata]